MEQKNVENSTIEKKIFVFSVFILALLIITAITISYLLLSNEILDLKQNVEDNDVPTFEEKEENTDTDRYSPGFRMDNIPVYHSVLRICAGSQLGH